jgi:hypothetical protein
VTGHTSRRAGLQPGDRTQRLGPVVGQRANASRLILQGAGVDADRVYQVSGKAGSDPLYPDDPSLGRQSPHRHRPAARGAGPAYATPACEPPPRMGLWGETGLLRSHVRRARSGHESASLPRILSAKLDADLSQ